MRRKKGMKTGFLRLFLFGLVAIQLIGCGSNQPTEAEVQQTVDAAVAQTVMANQSIETAVSLTVAANMAVAQVENAPTLTPLGIEVGSPTPVPTEPPPSTNTAVPTDIPADIPAVTDTPEPTLEPTATAVPPTNTPAPAQPTAPPAAAQPTVPPNPVLGGNILVNGSFEDGWYNQNGIPELQLPNGWAYEWDEGPTGFGSESWDTWVRPETRVLPDFQLPPAEQPLFIRDGFYTIKMFKGNGAISYRLMQDFQLPAGTYVFKVNLYPDLVQGYVNGAKQYVTDPNAGEIRFIAPDGGTGWFPPPSFGRWHTFEHTFSLAEAQTVRIGVGVRGRYALANNGWFLDDWSLHQVEN